MAIIATQMRPGMIIKHNNELHSVFTVEHRTPGNLRAFIQAKLRNLRTGAMFEHRFRSGDAIDKITVDETKMEYLYNDGDNYFFMDIANYEQIALNRDTLGDSVDYLTPNLQITVEFLRWQGSGYRSAADRRTYDSGDRAGTEVGDRFQRDQAGDDRDRTDCASAAVRQPGRQDPRGYRRRHLSFACVEFERGAR